MSTPINDGGPAFPCTREQHEYGLCGISMRDWFAGQATYDDISEHRGLFKDYAWEFTSEQARYRYADAMLAAREVKP